MSPRTATTGADGSRPLKRATTPVLATRVTDIAPNDSTTAANRSEVAYSFHESSGCRCSSRRSATRRVISS